MKNQYSERNEMKKNEIISLSITCKEYDILDILDLVDYAELNQKCKTVSEVDENQPVVEEKVSNIEELKSKYPCYFYISFFPEIREEKSTSKVKMKTD